MAEVKSEFSCSRCGEAFTVFFPDRNWQRRYLKAFADDGHLCAECFADRYGMQIYRSTRDWAVK